MDLKRPCIEISELKKKLENVTKVLKISFLHGIKSEETCWGWRSDLLPMKFPVLPTAMK